MVKIDMAEKSPLKEERVDPLLITTLYLYLVSMYQHGFVKDCDREVSDKVDKGGSAPVKKSLLATGLPWVCQWT